MYVYIQMYRTSCGLWWSIGYDGEILDGVITGVKGVALVFTVIEIERVVRVREVVVPRMNEVEELDVGVGVVRAEEVGELEKVVLVVAETYDVHRALRQRQIPRPCVAGKHMKL